MLIHVTLAKGECYPIIFLYTPQHLFSKRRGINFRIKFIIFEMHFSYLKRRVLLQLLMDKYLNDVMLGKCIKEKKKDYSFNNPTCIKCCPMKDLHCNMTKIFSRFILEV